jgi:hypothetical protein
MAEGRLTPSIGTSVGCSTLRDDVAQSVSPTGSGGGDKPQMPPLTPEEVHEWQKHRGPSRSREYSLA